MKSDQIEIVRATLTDVEKLQKLARQTCIEAFTDGNSDDNMQKYLDESFSAKKLSDELINPDSVFYIAYFGKSAIGYLKINLGNAQTELQNTSALEVQRIYVLKEFYGKNVGQFLFDKALETARQSNVEYIWLGVWENNFRAVGFYEKNGFVKFSEHIFKFGDDMQTDILMKRDLTE